MDNENQATTPDLAKTAELFFALYSGQYPPTTKKLSQKEIEATAQRYLELFVKNIGA